MFVILEQHLKQQIIEMKTGKYMVLPKHKNNYENNYENNIGWRFDYCS